MRRGLAIPFVIITSLFAAAPVFSQETPSREDIARTSIEWGNLPPLPDEHGFAAPFAGMSNSALLVAGGANFPDGKPWEGGRKAWHDRIFVLPDDATTWTETGQLPRPLAYGVSVTLPEGVLCIGGEDATSAFADVFLMEWNNSRVSIKDYPPLPGPLAYAAGVLLKDRVYVMGGTVRPGDTAATRAVWSLDLKDLEAGWKEESPWPGRPRMLAISAVLNDTIYLCGGADLAAGADGKPVRTYLTDAYAFTPGKGWRQIANMPRPAVAAPSPAPAVDPIEFLVLGGDDGSLVARGAYPEHPGFPSTALRYHAITDTWVSVPMEMQLPVTVPVVPKDGRFIIPSGETKPGVRTPSVTTLKFVPAKTAFGMLNFITLTGYLGMVLAIGVYCGLGNKTTDDYFRGGQRVPWWAAGLSIFATTLSSITYMAVPAKAFSENWVFALANLPILLLAPFIVLIVLPVFRRIDATSAYEYLERRFNLAVRLFGASSFILFHIGRMAIVLFLPALALATVSDLNIQHCILLMGAITIVYCVLGGITAVIWTDVVQSVVLLGGAALTVWLIISRVPDGATGLVREAASQGKFQLVNWTWDYTVASLWVILVGNLFSNLIPYTSDQTVVQRYMTTPNEKAAARSIWLNALIAIPATAMFFFVGTALYVYYRTQPNLIVPGSKADSVFPMFIAWELPAGVGGLIVAGIFAAAQSTISTSMNSVSTVIVTDFWKRLGRRALSSAGELRLARILTALLGIIGTGGALLLATLSIKSLWDLFLQLLALAGSALAGLFMLGIFTKRANGAGAMAGAMASVVTLYIVQRYTNIHFFLYAPVGIITCVVVGYVASLPFPRPAEHSLEMLTYPSIRSRPASSPDSSVQTNAAVS